MPTPVELRLDCYAILEIARKEPDNAVKRVLAARAFALAQQAQLQTWAESGNRPPAAAQ